MTEQNIIRLKKRVRWHWMPVFLGLFFLFNIGPWIAPVAMKAGYTGIGKAIYTVYAPFCHQMAQRSYFLFGEKIMYTPEEMPIQVNGNSGSDTMIFRRFKGNEEMGWKVAWSDRMVSMYGGMWLAAFLFAIVWRVRPVKPLPLWAALLLILPMALDGGTHFISDFGGLLEGFRYDNEWLATLTGHVFSADFYRGDVFGSFNSLMRLLTGLLFGFGVVWFAFPYLIRSTQQNVDMLDSQLERYSAR